MKIQLSDHFTCGRLLRFTLPSVIMMVFTSIYGVVDGLFVSNIVGKTPFAAVNLTMPFLMILGGVGFMVGTGGSALVARTLGEGDKPRANRYFSMLILFTVISGVAVSALGAAVLRPVLLLMGATDELLDDCLLYGRINLAFNTAFMLQNVFQSLLITAEKPKLGLAFTVAAGVTNMALDALFIGVLRWGVAGAALATGVSQCVGGVLPLAYFLRPNGSLLRLTSARMEARPLLKACANGSSEMMSNISSSIVGMVYNLQLLALAGENGVAAYGVLMYVQFIFVAMFIGYAIGSAPVVSFHYGAGHSGELRGLKRRSLAIMTAAGGVMALLAQLMADPVARVFVGYDAELLAMTSRAFRLFALSFLLAGVNIFLSSFFTALNNGAISAAISFLRTLVFQLFFVFALPALLGLDGIWLAAVAAEIAAAALSLAFLAANRKKYRY